MQLRKAVSAAFLMAVMLVAGRTASAAGCQLCSPELTCAESPVGALACVQGPFTCTVAFPCRKVSPSRAPDPGEQLSTWSLFEDDGALGPAVETEAGAISVGDDQRPGSGHARGPLVDTFLAFGNEYALVLADGAGDGFAVRRSVEGGQVRLAVSEVAEGQPGRVLAEAALGERDRMRVRVRVEGRERLLVLQAANLHPADAAPVVARLQATLKGAARTLPRRSEPLLKIRAL